MVFKVIIYTSWQGEKQAKVSMKEKFTQLFVIKMAFYKKLKNVWEKNETRKNESSYSIRSNIISKVMQVTKIILKRSAY